MLRLFSLISGSSGNCSIVTDGKTNIMIDCGTSGKRALCALDKIGIAPEELSAMLVTHEHTDHIQGVGVLARRFGLPVYATAGTHRAMSVGNIDDNMLYTVSADVTFEIGDIAVTPFSISHDAAEPCCYTLSDGSETVSVATDTGCISDSLMSRIVGSKSIILESNHDVDMLRFGDYTYSLKQRILGRYGHLSNKDAASAALELVKTGTEHIMLGHLSEKNNMPHIAQMETYNYLTDNGVNVGKDVTLQIAARYDVTSFDI